MTSQERRSTSPPRIQRVVGKFPIKEKCEETGEDKSEIFRSSGDNEGVRVWVRLYSVYKKDQKHVVTLFREGV